MAHTRKRYLIYPPNYMPGESRKFKVRHSRLQAWKEARRQGPGASVDVSVQTYPRSHSAWNASRQENLYEVVDESKAMAELEGDLEKLTTAEGGGQ